MVECRLLRGQSTYLEDFEIETTHDCRIQWVFERATDSGTWVYMVALFGRGGERRASRCLWGRHGRELRPSLNSTDLNFKAGLFCHSGVQTLTRNRQTAAESHVPARHSRTPDMHPKSRPNAIKHTSTRTSSNTVKLQSTTQNLHRLLSKSD